jgi:hypothetical protein
MPVGFIIVLGLAVIAVADWAERLLPRSIMWRSGAAFFIGLAVVFALLRIAAWEVS